MKGSTASYGALVLVVIGAVSACSHAPTTRPPDTGVSYTSLEPQQAERHELRDDEDFRYGQPLPDHRTLPVYPSARLHGAPALLAVCVELNVDEQGRVVDTRQLVDSADCAPLATADRVFFTAVDAAVRQWAFEPSVVCRLRDSDPADGTCADAASSEAVALLRAYRFVFELTPAGPRVSGDER